jgi:RimJ/RimL family protein N-acetyltransferase
VTLRRATAEDRDRLAALIRDERIAGSLSRLADEALEGALAATLAGSEDEAVLVVEDDDGGAVGLACWYVENFRSRIARIHTVAIDPGAQGRGHAVGALREVVRLVLEERGMHRLEAEVYGFNTAARAAFVRAGFTEEGVRRRAYDRHGAWQDGVHFGLLAEDRA